nr:hydrogen gas-evolving membrane-bound hydrogenase subunit E [Demequina sediminis]
MAGGVVAMVRARTRIAAVVVAGVVGFAMTLWFLALGAVDVAITQLLVEILTVTVFVLLLRRLPSRFVRERGRPRIAAGVVAVGAGVATVLGVWALTGRRELSPAATYLLTEGEAETGGANIVNTVLVEFRALDTLGELTVLGMAGLTIAALLHSRRAVPVRSAHIDESSPLADARSNTVFVRTVARILAPLIVVMSVVLLLRGHQEPGGGFIAALVGGAGFALAYMAAPSDTTARIRWPYLTLIGAGIVVGAGAGFVGYFDGSFLAPMSTYILGYKLTSSLVFDVGVYLAVIGVILAAYNLLGRQHRLPRDRRREEVGAR